MALTGENWMDDRTQARLDEFISEFTQISPRKLAYVLIVTQLGPEGNSIYANTSSKSQIIALMCQMLGTLTIQDLFPGYELDTAHITGKLRSKADSAPPGQGRPDPAG